MNKFVKSALAASALALVTATGVAAEGEKYILVSHAPDSDSWWNTIKNGIALAGEQMGVWRPMCARLLRRSGRDHTGNSNPCEMRC